MTQVLATPRDVLLVGPGLALFQGTVSGGGGGGSVPGALTGLSATAETSTTVSLAWTAPSGATAITVNYRLHGASSWTTATSSLSGTATAYAVTGLTAATAYDFQAFGTDSTGAGAAGEVDNVSTASSSGSGGAPVYLSAANVIPFGQSNCNFTFAPPPSGTVVDNETSDAGLTGVAAAGLKFFLQSGSSAMDFSSGYTAVGLNGIYPNGGVEPGGTWLVNPNVTTTGSPAFYPGYPGLSGSWVDPSQWATGAQWATFQTYLTGLGSSGLSNVYGMWFYWGENDSQRSYAEKATFKAALLRLMSLMRTAIGKSAAQLPFFFWGCMPSLGNDGGMCGLREAVYEICANSANNSVIVLPQAADVNPGNNNGTPDSWHGGFPNYGRWVRRAALPMARAILASNGAPSTQIPASVGTGLGPAISATSISGNVVTVTIAHDIGTDLVVTSDAANGTGWMLMDGGTPALPGNLISAISCTRVDATHLAVAFLGIPVYAPTLLYPYGNNRIGNPAAAGGLSDYAVTDNASVVTRTSGWDAGIALSDSGFDADMPIQMPMTVTGSGSSAVASCGVVVGTGPSGASSQYGFNLQNINMPAASSYAPGAAIESYLDDGSTQTVPYTAPASFQTGITSSLGVLPTTWVAGARGSGGAAIWYCPNTAPTTAGQYYMVGQGLNSSGQVVSRITRGPFTVT